MYNDHFPHAEKLTGELSQVFSFIDNCGFDKASRAWKKTDLFTLIKEIHTALIINKLTLDTVSVGNNLQDFFNKVAELYKTGKSDEKRVDKFDSDVFQYLKASTKATNDKYARIDRANIIAKIISATVEKPQKKHPKKASAKGAKDSKA